MTGIKEKADIIRCYDCPNYSGGKFKGKCKELNVKVDSVDYCPRDKVAALKKDA